jgi:hypothetical protein
MWCRFREILGDAADSLKNMEAFSLRCAQILNRILLVTLTGFQLETPQLHIKQKYLL